MLLIKPDRTSKLGQSGLLYGSKSLAEKAGVYMYFQLQAS